MKPIPQSFILSGNQKRCEKIFQFNYRWSKQSPFSLDKGIQVQIDDKDIVLNPSTEFQRMEIKGDKGVKFLFPKSIYFLPKEFKIK